MKFCLTAMSLLFEKFLQIKGSEVFFFDSGARALQQDCKDKGIKNLDHDPFHQHLHDLL